MRKIALIPKKDREALFRNTAVKMGMSEAIVEKDFWVCYMLDYLFYRSPWKDNLAFKGGTSLSKAYNLIERFSEDIDLILDWRVLGYGINEPWENRSNTKQIIQSLILFTLGKCFSFGIDIMEQFHFNLCNIV